MEEKWDLQPSSLSPEVIRKGFSKQLKKLTLLNTHSPRIFMVYTHSLDAQEGTEAPVESLIPKQIQGYLQPTILAPCPNRNKHLELNLYSVFAPQGNGFDLYNEYKEADMLYRQLCLLPKHAHSVDYVILCSSRLLQEYSEIEEVEKYTNYLRKMLSRELSKPKPRFDKLYTIAESALHALKSKCREGNQEFHSIYTELAFLQLRKEEKCKEFLLPHDLITILIDKNPAATRFSLPQDNSIYMSAGIEQDSKSFYRGIFQLLRRLFGKPELGACRLAIDNAYSTFINNTDPALWRPEDAKELAERYSAHEERKIARQRTRAKNSFSTSISSEEEPLTEVLPKSACKTTPILNTAELNEVLRTLYQQNYAKLPRLFSEEAEAIADTFVNIAILKEETVKAKEKALDAIQEREGRSSNVKEIQDNRLQSYERLYAVHETITIGKLFAPLSDTLLPKKLLLYGRAGIGKTVLCQYLANQWAEKPDRTESDNMACFRQFQAVFWIPLRELMDTLKDRRENGSPFKREMLVAEMVTACCLKDSDWQEKKKKQQLQMWLKANAESTLFILDGYDEIAEAAATSCALSDCVCAVLNHIQYKPYVILTSRPVAIHTRYNSFDRRLECMGFIDENILVFVRRYLKDLQQSNNCIAFLKGHPSIWGTAHIPLNLELLCWLWSRGKLSADNPCFTMAALYSTIISKMREINVDEQKRPSLIAKWQYADNRLTEITFADLAEEFFPFLSFHAMQQSGVLLKGEDLKQWLGTFIKIKDPSQKEGMALDTKQKKLLQACIDLSFLKSTQQGGRHLFDHTYYFIHLSFQEFFAAKYYQQAFERSKVKVIEHFQTHKYTPSYQLTWWMTAGLLYQDGNDLGLRAFFQTLCAKPLDLIGIHHANLLSHCLDECQADEEIDVIAGLTQHLARILESLLEKNGPAGAWNWQEVLLRCSNLLRAKSFQDIGLRFFEKPGKIRLISSNTAVFLSYVVTRQVIACLKYRTIDSSARGELALALAQHLDLTLEKIQTLFACITDAALHVLVRGKLAQTLAQHPDLATDQIQSLIAYIASANIHFEDCEEIAQALAQRSDLTPEQVQSLLACVKNTTIHFLNRAKIAQALAQYLALAPDQERSLIADIINMTIYFQNHGKIAQAPSQRSDLTLSQAQSRLTYLIDIVIRNRIYGKFAPAPGKVQPLVIYIPYKKIYSMRRKRFVPHLNQAPKQVQSLITCLIDERIYYWTRVEFARAVAQRSDLTSEQIQSLIACITNRRADSWICVNLAQALTKAPIPYSSFPVQELQQLLAYCLKEKMICEEYPFLIFPILMHYYSKNQMEKHIALPSLDTFLTMPSTGFALAKKQALFIYDVVNGMALLRLDTQEIKIPLHLAQNPFRTLSEKTWRGGLHPIETDEIFKRKANDDSKIDLSLLSSQANEIVTTIISITTMPSSTLDSTTILKRNESTSAMQDAWDLALDFTREVAVEPIIPALKLTQRLKNLMEDSMSITKKYCFQLTRVYACILTITFISSKESSRAEGRQLDTLQREMEACLQDANLKNYACKFKGESEEILKVTGDKEVIDALADMLVRQGLSIRWAEANKYSAFFKAEKALKGEDISTLTCPMQ